MNDLTPKEAAIVRLVVAGLSNRDVATQIGTSEQVIKNHLREIYVKMGVDTRIHLFRRYYAKAIAAFDAAPERFS
jgi:DNA-binding NarL/FixJ family response regulator